MKREPKSPICVVGIGIKSCLEKLSFFGCWKSLSAASKCRKTYPCDYRISKFSGGACPRTPLGDKALRVLPILCPGVKLSCPPVQNLNKPPVYQTGEFSDTMDSLYGNQSFRHKSFQYKWFQCKLKQLNCTKTLFTSSIHVVCTWTSKTLFGEYSPFFKPRKWNYLHLDWINLYQNVLYQNDFVSKRLLTICIQLNKNNS